VHGGRLDEGTHLLSKPYTREALARKVRQMLSNQTRKDGASRNMQHPSEPIEITNAPAKLLRVLVVEDEPFIRTTTVEYLEDLGYTVFEAKDAASALKILETEQIQLLLTDVGLPGQTGIELALQSRDRFPDIKVVLATGYNRVLDDAHDQRLSDAVILTKPYDVESLSRALNSFCGA
jgi:CheY-like chemotaxis protein